MDGARDFTDGMMVVVIFVAIGLKSGDAPGEAICVNGELSEFVGDDDIFGGILGGNFVTKSDAVVKNAKTNSDEAAGLGVFREIKSGFIIIIADGFFLAPQSVPCFIQTTRMGADQL